jgi:hypothetical protein
MVEEKEEGFVNIEEKENELSRFAIVFGPLRNWHVDTMKNIMYACIIMHNMVVEDERNEYNGNFDYEQVDNNSTAQVFNDSLSPILQHCLKE